MAITSLFVFSFKSVTKYISMKFLFLRFGQWRYQTSWIREVIATIPMELSTVVNINSTKFSHNYLPGVTLV